MYRNVNCIYYISTGFCSHKSHEKKFLGIFSYKQSCEYFEFPECPNRKYSPRQFDNPPPCKPLKISR
jgi:hypothetical protein